MQFSISFPKKKILLGKTNEKGTEFQKSRWENFESKTISFPIQKILLGKTNEKWTEFQKSRGENFESFLVSFPIEKILCGKTNEKRTEFQKSYKVGGGKKRGFWYRSKKNLSWIK